MMSMGIDLARSAAQELLDGVVAAWPYLLLVVGLGALYFILQLVADHPASAPMRRLVIASPSQAQVGRCAVAAPPRTTSLSE